MVTKRKKARPARRGGKRAASPRATARRAAAIVSNSEATIRQRVEAAAIAPLAVCNSNRDLKAMLTVLRNKDEAIEVRLAVLQSLQAASFSVLAFESCRGDYIATLRKIADDPDPELRQRVLGLLAREKDGFAQKRLIEGLRNPDKALVPPEKALQLLSYDPHADAYSAAREIVKDSPNSDARREALRLLAADATAAPLFQKLLRDKNELPQVRQISASALHALKPETLQVEARKIVLDKADDDDIKATSLTALTHFGSDEAISKDETLLKSVERLRDSASKKVKQSARQFLSRHRR